MMVIFANRLNLYLGISDIIFVLFTDVIFDSLTVALKTLPTYAVIAKVVPRGVEGTIFAFMTGT